VSSDFKQIHPEKDLNQNHSTTRRMYNVGPIDDERHSKTAERLVTPRSETVFPR